MCSCMLVLCLSYSYLFLHVHVGPIPESLSKLENLTVLSLFENQLTGAQYAITTSTTTTTTTTFIAYL